MSGLPYTNMGMGSFSTKSQTDEEIFVIEKKCTKEKGRVLNFEGGGWILERCGVG
jgi:hypothetical protein